MAERVKQVTRTAHDFDSITQFSVTFNLRAQNQPGQTQLTPKQRLQAVTTLTGVDSDGRSFQVIRTDNLQSLTTQRHNAIETFIREQIIAALDQEGLV